MSYKRNTTQTVYTQEISPQLKKCEFCKGKDGKEKDIYETLQSAIETAKFLEVEREVYLNPYACPFGNGYHLTKNNASSKITERQETIFKNNDIPVSGKSWEFISAENSEKKEEIIEYFTNRNNATQVNNNKDIPIKKIVPDMNKDKIKISGIVMEIVNKIDIGKIFNLDLDNLFCFSLIKDFYNPEMCQMTIFVDDAITNQINSYTILIKKEMLEKNHIKKNNYVQLNIMQKSINAINIWYCEKLQKTEKLIRANTETEALP